jgi:hypothetical protein
MHAAIWKVAGQKTNQTKTMTKCFIKQAQKDNSSEIEENIENITEFVCLQTGSLVTGDSKCKKVLLRQHEHFAEFSTTQKSKDISTKKKLEILRT